MKQQFGFTLIEISIVIAIFGVISTMAMSFIVTTFKATRIESEQAEAISQARNAMSIMKKEIRGANSSQQGDYPIDTIDNQDFIFYADVDNDNEYEKIRYYLNDIELIKEITEPGALNDYSGAPASTTIARYVNNDSEDIFNYYDSSYNITAAINEVRLISVSLKINVTPTIAPNDIYVNTDVTLRNLKSNL